MFRTASRLDQQGIIALWKEAFGDSEASVAHFFESFPDCISYVAEENGSIVSMVHVLPQVLSPDLPAAYVYAVATRKSHRGQSLCRKLMAFAENDLRSRFRCAVLTPGEPELFRFYEKLGYKTAFYRTRTAFSHGTPVSVEEYARLREQVLTVPHMVYDHSLLQYAREVYGLTFYKTNTGCAAVGHTTEVLPEDTGGDPFAMLKWLGEPMALPNAYLGFPLE